MKQPSERMMKQAIGFIAVALIVTTLAIVLDHRFTHGPKATNPSVAKDGEAQPKTVNASIGK